MNSLPIVRRLAVLYGLLLVLVILAANRGLIPMWWAFRRLSWADKLGHFLLIGTLALLVNLALGARRWNLGRFSGLRGSLWISVAVVLEEISQHWMKYRAFELADLAADFLGIFVFGQLARWWLAWRERVTLRDQSPVADLKTISVDLKTVSADHWESSADHWERRV